MNLLVIPVQSVSDVITNSSSEVFILDTDKTCEEVNTILGTITSGFDYPEVFSLKDFREWRKKLRNGEIERDWSYPGSIFNIADGWFKDPEDEEDVLDLRISFLFDPFKIETFGDIVLHSYSYDYEEEIHRSFINYINDNWDKIGDSINGALIEMGTDPVNSICWELLHRYSYTFQATLRDFAREFLKNYNGPKPTVWDVEEQEDVRKLDGKLLVVSIDENSIPYDTWDKINSLFNGWNVHLG